MKKQIITADDLKKWLKDKTIVTDCDHKCSQHNLSNTLIVTADGEVLCHSCYL